VGAYAYQKPKAWRPPETAARKNPGNAVPIATRAVRRGIPATVKEARGNAWASSL